MTEPITCDLHKMLEEVRRERWEEQRRVNETLFRLLEVMQKEISGLKTWMGWVGGFMAAIQFLSPLLWKYLGVLKP